MEEKFPKLKHVRKGYARGAPIPWPVKMWLKIILANLPFSYDFWVRLGIFKHGDTSTELGTLYKCFNDHFSYYQDKHGGVPEYSLELGPGDSIGHALCGHAKGVKGGYYIDVGDFATRDPAHYQEVCTYLEKHEGLKDKPKSYDRDVILEFTDSYYGIDGVKSLKTVPNEKLDFSHSHAVLEHVRRDEFDECMQELFRAHKSGSVSRHYVDLHDHLGGALNSFRFSPKFWESAVVGKAGFYTNRLTMNDMIKSAEKAGFAVEIHYIIKWEDLPTPRQAMHSVFADKTEEELNVCTFLIVMAKS